MPTGRGLEFGSYGYKSAIVRVSGGAFLVEDLWVLPRPLAAEGPAGEDPAWAQQARRLAGGNCIFDIAGRDLMVRYSRFPVVPPWRLEMMVDFELEQAAARAQMEVVSDFMLATAPSGPGEDMKVMGILARREAIETGFAKARSAGFRCRGGLPVPMALFYAYRASTLYDADKTALLVDVGYSTTSLAACFAGRVFFMRNLSDGMVRLVRAINDTLGVGLERSEAFLRERLDISTAPAESASVQLKQAHQAALGALGQYAAAVAATLRFAGQQLGLGKPLAIDRLVLSGGGALLPGVRQALERAFGAEAAVLSVGSQLATGPRVNPGLAGPQAVAAVGLAAAAVAAELPLLLVPPAEVARRDFWRRRIFGYLAPAAAVLLALLATTAGHRRLADLEGRVSALAAPVQQAEERKQRCQAELEAFQRDAAAYEALRHHAGQAAVGSLLFETLHANMPAGMFARALKLEPSEPGTLAAELTGRSKDMDATGTLKNLNILVDALRTLEFVQSASSTTLEEKAAAAVETGVPFRVNLLLRYAKAPAEVSGEPPAAVGAER